MPTAQSPSPKLVAAFGPPGGSDDHVPQFCELNPASVGRIVTIAGPLLLSLAKMLLEHPPVLPAGVEQGPYPEGLEVAETKAALHPRSVQFGDASNVHSADSVQAFRIARG
jgi:hypothetical protein